MPEDMWFMESDCIPDSVGSSKDKGSHKVSKNNLEQSSPKDLPDNIKPDEVHIDVLKGVTKHIAPILCGLSPNKQKDVDRAIATIHTSEGNQ